MGKLNLEGSWKTIFMVILLIVLGLYLYGKFTVEKSYVCTTADVAEDAENPYGCSYAGEVVTYTEFNRLSPSEAAKTPVDVMKFLLIGIFVLGIAGLAIKLGGGSLSKRDAYVIVMIIIAIILAWNPIIKPLLGSTNIESIAFDAGRKLGLLP